MEKGGEGEAREEWMKKGRGEQTDMNMVRTSLIDCTETLASNHNYMSLLLLSLGDNNVVIENEHIVALLLDLLLAKHILLRF